MSSLPLSARVCCGTGLSRCCRPPEQLKRPTVFPPFSWTCRKAPQSRKQWAFSTWSWSSVRIQAPPPIHHEDDGGVSYRRLWYLYFGIHASVIAAELWTSHGAVPPDYLMELQDTPQDVQVHPHMGVAVAVSKPENTRYRPLLYKKDIRLLVLHPAKSITDDVHLHMEHSSLEQHDIKFEALSYAWGDVLPTGTIFISDQPFEVRENLSLALRYLRYKDRPRFLWVDSLCIDQTDVDERSQQVRLMGDVFSEADRVIIWLGDDTGDAKEAMDALDIIYRDFYNEYRAKRPPTLVWEAHAPAIMKRVVSRDMFEGHLALEQINWIAVLNFLHRPWFHRLWVYQEAANARRAVVRCGQEELPWGRLAGALSFLAHHNIATTFLDSEAAFACSHVMAMEAARSQQTRDPLFHAVLTSSYGACSDPRDKVFAVMSVANGKDIFDWEVSFDYTLTVHELFKRFAIWDIVRCGSLRSLSCAAAPLPDGLTSLSLPSWVPDWTKFQDPNILTRFKGKTCFCAAGDTRQELWFTHDKTMLHVKGVLVDSIEVISSRPRFVKSTSLFYFDGDAVESLVSIDTWIRECWQLASAGKAMTPGIYDAFWRTMVCGLTANGEPAPRVFSKYFRTYLKYIRELPHQIQHYHWLNYEMGLVTRPYTLQFKREYPEDYDVLFKPKWSLSPRFYASQPDFTLHFQSWYRQTYKTNVPIEESLQKWSANRRFCRTLDGRLARVPEHAAVGDTICVLYGSDVPYVLRLQEDGTYIVIGECYLHGMMHGEALALAGKPESFEPEIFRIR